MDLTRAIVALALLRTLAPAALHAQANLRLVEELRIGPAEEGPASFATIRALEVDRSGRIYILENRPQDIRVFSPQGQFVRHVGREGAGPGEYQNAGALVWDSLGRLLVVDEQHLRNSYFDTTGAFIESRLRPVSGFWGWNWGGAILNDGRTVEALFVPGPANERARAFGVVDARGVVRDTFRLTVASAAAATWRLQRGTRSIFSQVPFAPVSLVAVDPRGYLWTAHSDRYRIVQLDLKGDTVRVLERRVDAEPVSRQEADSAVDAAVQRFGAGPDIDRALIPRTKAFFTALTPDDAGRLWVRVPARAGQGGTAFDVFDPQGRYLGTATTPLRLGYSVFVRRGAMYAIALDENDVPFVVRLRIVGIGR